MSIKQEKLSYNVTKDRKNKTYSGKIISRLKVEGVPEAVLSRKARWLQEQFPAAEVNWGRETLLVSFLFKVEKPSLIPTEEEALEQTRETLQRIQDPSFYQPLLEQIAKEQELFADEYRELLQHIANQKRLAEDKLQKARERLESLLKLPFLKRELPWVVESLMREETFVLEWRKLEETIKDEQAGGTDPLLALELECQTKITDILFENSFNSTSLLHNALQFEGEKAQREALRTLRDIFFLLRKNRKMKET